ncbi:MAG: hypothetical protein BGO69_12450 [Bacteroidetes bacterium 46-16]|nr:MAG: hypothetical protein BGO69_12450 [Bacteroidetes bacterium 46-16]
MKTIDRELQDYVAILSEEQKETVLNVVKALAPNAGNDSDWEDEEFVAETDRLCGQYHSKTASAATSRSEGRNIAPGIRN